MVGNGRSIACHGRRTRPATPIQVLLRGVNMADCASAAEESEAPQPMDMDGVTDAHSNSNTPSRFTLHMVEVLC